MKKLQRIISLMSMWMAVAPTYAQAPSPASPLVFHSSDEALKKSFDWARNMALSYSHTDGDPVGPWCEAVSPIVRHSVSAMSAISRWVLTCWGLRGRI